MEALGWLIFLAALIVSVMLHETGHFVTAKRFGMKATQYFFGFGPTLWSTQRGETEYGVKALPAGGFVKIIGMTSLEDVDPEDEPRSFRRAPGWQRLIVLAAGSFMHFLFAAVLIFGVAVVIGAEAPNYGSSQLGTVNACVPATKADLENGVACTNTEAKSPALAAGLQVGDRVTSFNGTAVSSFTQLKSEILKVKPGTPVTLTVDRNGRTLTKQIKLAEVPGYGSFFGIAPTIIYQPQSPLAAVKDVGSGFAVVVTGSVKAIGELPGAVPYLFKSDRATTPAGNVGSVVGAAQATGDEVAMSAGWQAKVSWVLLLIASLNIFWGVFNLLPLLPMDGGHIAVVIWERIRARFARLLGRPDPGLFDYRKLIPVSFSIFAVVIVFSLLLVAADIVNPVNFG